MPKTSNTDKPAIVVHDVRKTFKIKHTHSFKETFIGFLKRKKLSTDFNALDGISFEVAAGESVAILGYNGSGKSTTLKLVSGVLRPDAGWVRTRGRVAGLIEVGAGFHPDLTGRENVFLNAAILGMTKSEIEARFDDIVAFSEIGEFIDNEVKHYSSGMFLRLAFSVAIHTELDVLLVDEILSVGDAPFRAKCRAKIRELVGQGKTMLVVSHDVGTVKDLCTRGVVIHKGKMLFDGPIGTAVDKLSAIESVSASKAPKISVRGGIRSLHSQHESKFGAALANEVKVTENGGGWLQRFEYGVITYSNATKQASGLLNGLVLDAYLAEHGPAGRWGFTTTGGLLEGRVFVFQNGTAQATGDSAVEFTPVG